MISAQANRGRPLEELIIMANHQYRAQRRAVIHKVPTAWIPLRDSRGRVVNAKVEEKAAVDFLGVYRGRPLAFDAKHCSRDRIRWDRVDDHQAQFLEDWTRDGGIGFILVGFGMQRFFVVPWEVWWEGLLGWRYEHGPASISVKQMQHEWEVRRGGGIVLDYLAIVDRLFFEEAGRSEQGKGARQTVPHD